MKIFALMDLNVSQRQQRTFNQKKIEELLYSINQTCSGQFYMVDFLSKKVIVGSPYASILCGYPKELLEQEGFGFYLRLFKEDEWKRVDQMKEAAYKVLTRYPLSCRKKFVLSLDLRLITNKNEEIVLHHKSTPYKLCKNGHLWLSLCYVTEASSEKMRGCASFANMETGERYRCSLVDGEPVLIKTESTNQEELQILKLLVKGFSDKQMCGLMGMSISTFKQRKRQLYKKLEANTSAEAIHRAHLLGII